VEIIKSTPTEPKKCEYGDFELKPEDGWKVSQTFIDYDSKLLIVSVSLLDKSKWIKGYGGTIIPTKEYKIDLATLSILTPLEWQRYFSYDSVEIISEDKRYKLISKRVFEPERNSDGFTEELYDLNSGKLISSGSSIAFAKNKRENLLDSFLRSVKEKEDQKRILEAKPTLEQFYFEQINKLKDYDEILCYYDPESVFQLSYVGRKYILSSGGQLPSDYTQWKSIKFDFVKSYDSVDDFWSDFIRDEKWYVRFKYLNAHGRLSSKVLVLAKHIISFFNELRREHKFTYSEYDKINNWSNLVASEGFRKTELKQWCSNCFKEVYYNVRYPKYICSDCMSKDKFDSRGNLLEFSNVDITGGFRITYMDSEGSIIREDETEGYCECLIDNKLFFAKEAKFGGIVIQKKE